MGPIEKELRNWWRDYQRGPHEGLRVAREFYVGAIGTATQLIGGQPDWEDAMSEAIEAAGALRV